MKSSNLNKYVEVWYMMDTNRMHALYQHKYNSTSNNNNDNNDDYSIVSLPSLLNSKIFDEEDDNNHNDILMERLLNIKNTVSNCIQALYSGFVFFFTKSFI